MWTHGVRRHQGQFDRELTGAKLPKNAYGNKLKKAPEGLTSGPTFIGLISTGLLADSSVLTPQVQPERLMQRVNTAKIDGTLNLGDIAI
jgi:hypothetical protein